MTAEPVMNGANPIILYDGVCGLCNRLVQFLLKHDKDGRLRFASLQSDFAVKVLGRHGLDPKDLDTVHVVVNYDQPGERVLQRSDAVLRAGRELGGFGARLHRSLKSCRAGFGIWSIAWWLRIVIACLESTTRACSPIRSQRSRFLDV